MSDFTPDLIFTANRPMAAYSTETDGLSYPAALDMRDLVLNTEDQGKTSMCAAYTATSWLEALLWRRTGMPINYDPVALYKMAKTIDKFPRRRNYS